MYLENGSCTLYNVHGSGSYFFIRRMNEPDVNSSESEDLGYARSFEAAIKLIRSDVATIGTLLEMEVIDMF